MTLDEFIKIIKEIDMVSLNNAQPDLQEALKAMKRAAKRKDDINNRLKELGRGKGGSTNAYDHCVKQELINSSLDGIIDPNNSQNPVDFRSVTGKDFEFKSTKTDFRFNDSYPKEDIWYGFHIKGKVIIIQGLSLPLCNKEMCEFAHEYKNVLHDVKRKYQPKLKSYGMDTYPRPNYSLSNKIITCFPCSGIFDKSIFYTDDVYNKGVPTTKKKYNTRMLDVAKINAMLDTEKDF